mgnify:CR=1 FL=1
MGRGALNSLRTYYTKVMPQPAFAQFGMTAPQSTSHGHLPAQNYSFEAENGIFPEKKLTQSA